MSASPEFMKPLVSTSADDLLIPVKTFNPTKSIIAFKASVVFMPPVNLLIPKSIV